MWTEKVSVSTARSSNKFPFRDFRKVFEEGIGLASASVIELQATEEILDKNLFEIQVRHRAHS